MYNDNDYEYFFSLCKDTEAIELRTHAGEGHSPSSHVVSAYIIIIIIIIRTRKVGL